MAAQPGRKRKKTDSCPLCGKPSEPAHRPFCGRGCKDRDLLQWLGDGYRIAGPPARADSPEEE